MNVKADKKVMIKVSEEMCPRIGIRRRHDAVITVEIHPPGESPTLLKSESRILLKK